MKQNLNMLLSGLTLVQTPTMLKTLGHFRCSFKYVYVQRRLAGNINHLKQLRILTGMNYSLVCGGLFHPYLDVAHLLTEISCRRN